MNDSFVVKLNDMIHDRVEACLRHEPRAALLDVGAGDGSLSARMRDKGFTVTAVDLVTTDFHPVGIAIHSADLNEGIPFSDGEFGVVVATEIIEHLENPWFFIREMYRITRPGGVAVVSTPNLANIYTRAWYALTGRLYNFLDAAYHDIGHITPVHLWNLERMVEGLFDIEEVTVNASPVPRTRRQLPSRSRLLGQCIVVALRRRPGPVRATPRLWAESRILRE